MFFFPQSYSMSQMLLGGKGEVSWEPLFNKVQYNKPLYCQPLPSSPRGACESRVKNEIDFCLWVLKLSSSLSNVLRASWEIWGVGGGWVFVCLFALYFFFSPPDKKMKWECRPWLSRRKCSYFPVSFLCRTTSYNTVESQWIKSNFVMRATASQGWTWPFSPNDRGDSH